MMRGDNRVWTLLLCCRQDWRGRRSFSNQGTGAAAGVVSAGAAAGLQEHWNFEVYDFLSWRLDGVNGANREQRRTAPSQSMPSGQRQASRQLPVAVRVACCQPRGDRDVSRDAVNGCRAYNSPWLGSHQSSIPDEHVSLCMASSWPWAALTRRQRHADSPTARRNAQPPPTSARCPLRTLLG